MQLNERSHIVTCVDILGYKEVLRRDDQEEIRRIEIEFQYFVEANIQKRANFPDFRCVSSARKPERAQTAMLPEI